MDLKKEMVDYFKIEIDLQYNKCIEIVNKEVLGIKKYYNNKINEIIKNKVEETRLDAINLLIYFNTHKEDKQYLEELKQQEIIKNNIQEF